MPRTSLQDGVQHLEVRDSAASAEERPMFMFQCVGDAKGCRVAREARDMMYAHTDHVAHASEPPRAFYRRTLHLQRGRAAAALRCFAETFDVRARALQQMPLDGRVEAGDDLAFIAPTTARSKSCLVECTGAPITKGANGAVDPSDDAAKCEAPLARKYIDNLARERHAWMLTLGRYAVPSRKNLERTVTGHGGTECERSSLRGAMRAREGALNCCYRVAKRAADFCARCGSILLVTLEFAADGVSVDEKRETCQSCTNNPHGTRRGMETHNCDQVLSSRSGFKYCNDEVQTYCCVSGFMFLRDPPKGASTWNNIFKMASTDVSL